MYKTISEMVSQGMVLRVSIYKVHFKVLTGTYFTILNRMYKRNLVVFLSFFYKLTPKYNNTIFMFENIPHSFLHCIGEIKKYRYCSVLFFLIKKIWHTMTKGKF